MTFVDPQRPDELVTALATQSDLDLAAASDAALARSAREGHGGAAELLLDRHLDGMRCLVDEVGLDQFHAAQESMRQGLESGSISGVPIRIAWLATLGQASLSAPVLEARWGHDLIWEAYLRLPEAWQTAVWHHVVEGDATRELAVFLGMGDFDARRALAAAASTLRRSVLQAHEGGPSARCELIGNRLLHSAPSALDAAAMAVLREHAKDCDPCLHLARDLFSLEYSLADVLLARVLGPLGGAYVRSKPGPRPLGAAPRLGTVTGALARPAKPAALLGLTGVAAAAVFSAMTLGTPSLLRDDRVVLAAPSIEFGRRMEPLPSAVTEPGVISVPRPRTAPLVVRDAPVVPADDPGDGSLEPEVPGEIPVAGDGGTTPEAPDPGDPGTPSTPDPDSGSGSGGSGSGGGDQPLVSTTTPVGDVSVDVDLQEGQVEVQVGGVTLSPELPGLGGTDNAGDPVGSIVGGLLGG